jgi:hypothetical protein
MVYFSLSSPSKDDSSCTDESSPGRPDAPPAAVRPDFIPNLAEGRAPIPRLENDFNRKIRNYNKMFSKFKYLVRWSYKFHSKR